MLETGKRQTNKTKIERRAKKKTNTKLTAASDKQTLDCIFYMIICLKWATGVVDVVVYFVLTRWMAESIFTHIDSTRSYTRTHSSIDANQILVGHTYLYLRIHAHTHRSILRWFIDWIVNEHPSTWTFLQFKFISNIGKMSVSVCVCPGVCVRIINAVYYRKFLRMKLLSPMCDVNAGFHFRIGMYGTYSHKYFK